MAEKKYSMVKLKELLYSDNFQDNLEALKLLGKLKSEMAITMLVSALKHPKWGIRKEASAVLVSLGKEVLPFLKSGLKDDNIDLKYWSIRTIGEIGTEEGAKLLSELYFKEEDHNFREHIVTALAQTKTKLALKTLIKALGDENWNVRSKAAFSIIDYYGKEATKELEEALKENFGKLGNKDIVFWALKLLARFKKDDYMPVLKKMLSSFKDKEKLIWITVALGEIDTKPAIVELIKLFSSDSWLVRKQASDILSRSRNEEVDSLLQQVFNKGNSDQKYWALITLTNRKKEKLIPVIKNLLKSDDPDLRYYCVDALGIIGNSEALDILISLFQDKMWIIKNAAAEKLMKHKDDAMPKLIEVLKTDDEDMLYWTLQALSKIGRDSIKYLAEFKDHPNDRVRYYVIEALKNIKTEATVKLLIEFFKDKKWSVRNKASEVLASFGAWVIDTVIMSMLEENDDLRFWSGKVLANFKEQALTKINMYFNSDDLEKRKAAVVALSTLKSKEALKMVIDVLEEGSPQEIKLLLKNLEGLSSFELAQNLVKYFAKKVEAQLKENPDENIEESTLGSSIIQILSTVTDQVKKQMLLWLTSKTISEIEKIILIKVSVYYFQDLPEETTKYLMKQLIAEKDKKVKIEILSAFQLGEEEELYKYKKELIHLLSVEQDEDLIAHYVRLLSVFDDMDFTKVIIKKYIQSKEEVKKKLDEVMMDTPSIYIVKNVLGFLSKAPKYFQAVEGMIKAFVFVSNKREQVLQLLDDVPDQIKGDLMVMLANYQEEMIFSKIFESLKKIKDEKAFNKTIEKLAPLVASENWVAREKVSKELINYGAKVTIPILFAIKNSKDDFTKMQLQSILEEFGADVLTELEKASSIPQLKAIASKLMIDLKKAIGSSAKKKSAPKKLKEDKKQTNLDKLFDQL